METATLERMLYGVHGSAEQPSAERCLTPVVHGDITLDDQQQVSISSTEAIFEYLTPLLRPQRIVLVGEAGVFTADPRRDPDAVRIAQINAANIETVLTQTGASHGADVTGGMAAKVAHMWRLVQAVPGLTVQLVGVDPLSLRQALRGEPVADGTIISQ
jgi:isopentenyl phosphate kinase